MADPIAGGIEIPDLRRYTLELLRQVPPGKVTTYRALAIALGDPRAARAVGQIMATNEHPDVYPCYKVVHSDGSVGAYSAPGGTATKIEKLQADGVPIEDGRVVRLREHVFYQFQTEKPLERLRRLQEELSGRVVREPALSLSDIRTVGGVDLAYPGPWEGVGAYVALDRGTGRVLAAKTHRCEVTFPYIPTYLAFREMPVLLPLLQQVRDEGKLAEVLLVDGSGILHHRHAGIASHLGVLLDHPTVGVIKRLLYGSVDVKGMEKGEVRPVRDPQTGDVIGMAVKTHERADPLYVSIGHKVGLEMAVELVRELSGKHKLPEPIRRAHELCTQEARARRSQEGRTAPLLQADTGSAEKPKEGAQRQKKPRQMALDL